MLNSAKNFIKKHLPRSMVASIQGRRKHKRQQERFAFNNGADIVVPIKADQGTFQILVNPFLNGGVDDDIYHTGCWEPEITAEIAAHLPAHGTFVDIGANIGYHSLFAAAYLGGSGQVFSFEPLPRLQEQMQRSIVLNNFTHIEIKPVALADVPGTAILSLVDENVGASSLKNVATDRAVGATVEVPVRTLDSYADEIKRIDVVKIDIEGSEFEALKGGEQLLSSCKPVIILEFSPHVYEKDYAGKSLELFLYLKNLGYDITVIGEQAFDIEQMLRAGKLQELHQNFLCTPRP